MDTICIFGETSNMDGNLAMNSHFGNMSGKDMEEQIKLDEFHFHEAADRSHIIIGMIQDYILDHPVFCQVQEFKEKAEKAQELFSEIYQDIANVEEKQLADISTTVSAGKKLKENDDK